MAIKKYTIAEFRKQTREAFNEVEMGGRVFISRHNTRYELVKADIQNGKVQMAQDAVDTLKKPTVTPTNFPKNGDPGAQIETADDLSDAFGPVSPAEKNSSADALGIDTSTITMLQHEKKELSSELAKIDIDTQDPDEVERGSELAARIGDIEAELKRRGA